MEREEFDEQSPAWQCIDLEADGSRTTGVCECCGCVSRVVWGYAALHGEGIAHYFVHWTVGEVRKHGANFDLILGPWGDGTRDDERRSVSLAYRLFEGGPSFMVIDAHGRQFCQSPVAGVPLSRAEVIGSPLAALAFALVDAVCVKDPRVKELVPG